MVLRAERLLLALTVQRKGVVCRWCCGPKGCCWRRHSRSGVCVFVGAAGRKAAVGAVAPEVGVWCSLVLRAVRLLLALAFQVDGCGVCGEEEVGKWRPH